MPIHTENLHTDSLVFGSNSTIHPTARIRGKHIRVGNYCNIGENVEILCPDGFTLGDCSRIGPNSRIECWRFDAGAYLYCDRNLEVGRGGCLSSKDSTVTIGSGVQLNEGVILNPNCQITIGDDVGIGAQTSIWTHGAYLSTHPSKFAPVSIGNRVWIQGRTNILPGVTVGEDSVVLMGSVVSKSLQPRSLCGGTPCKVIKENCYPVKDQDPAGIIRVIIKEYMDSLRWRGLDAVVRQQDTVVTIDGASFGIDTLTAVNVDTALAEDFRDFIRRHGYRIYTGKPFKSIPHPDIERWKC